MLKVRTATAQDVPLILSFIRELAVYEREPNAVHCTEADLHRYGFGTNPIFRVVIAEWDKQPAGMALIYYYFSTWAGRPGIFLEDLYVRPQFRKKRIGEALMVQLAQLAIHEDCFALRWDVLDWNKPALNFYEHLGAEFRKQWYVMQVTGENLKRLAERNTLDNRSIRTS